MKRISILACILGVCFVSAAWAQQPATKSPFGRHVPHRMANQTSRTRDVTVGRSFHAQANPDHKAKIWELGTYPGGSWFATWHINDFGVIVGFGDVPDSDGVLYNHALAVPLFGPHAGEWIDLGTLGGEQGWEEPYTDVSNTGLVVSHSIAQDGHMHGVAWTKANGPVGLGTLADTHDPRYASYNASVAFATNKLGTLIGGGSGPDENPIAAPVVWTQSNVWMNGKFVTKWKIHKLDTSAFPDLTEWNIYGLNDYGQIIGIGYNDDVSIMIAALWNPRTDGKGWNFVSLPQSPSYPLNQAYGINEKGEIIGSVNSTDFVFGPSLLWKPLDKNRTRYSKPIELPFPTSEFSGCYGVGINDLGDMVGDCWDEAYTMDLPTRWTTKNLTFSEIINFPADWGFAWGVNNNRIATVTYTGGEKCSAGVPWTYTCGGAIHLH